MPMLHWGKLLHDHAPRWGMLGSEWLSHRGKWPATPCSRARGTSSRAVSPEAAWILFTKFSSPCLALLPSRGKAVFKKKKKITSNCFKMIYELLCQAPNSFITCFLKESSKEQSVYCWVIAHCQHSFPWFMKLKKPKHYTMDFRKSCIPFSEDFLAKGSLKFYTNI